MDLVLGQNGAEQLVREVRERAQITLTGLTYYICYYLKGQYAISFQCQML